MYLIRPENAKEKTGTKQQQKKNVDLVNQLSNCIRGIFFYCAPFFPRQIPCFTAPCFTGLQARMFYRPSGQGQLIPWIADRPMQWKKLRCKNKNGHPLFVINFLDQSVEGSDSVRPRPYRNYLICRDRVPGYPSVPGSSTCPPCPYRAHAQSLSSILFYQAGLKFYFPTRSPPI